MSGSISSPAETEKWALDPLGNWTTYQFDGDGDGNFTSAADIDDARSYDSPAGLANEITEWDPYPADSQNNPVEPVYDAAGNMTDDNYQYRYTYDAWNRLVKVEDQGVTPAVVGAYGYDGLNRRITRTIGSDDAIHEYYTESWQRIESRPGGESSTEGVSLFVFGIRYIDDIIMRQRDANASGPPEERRYYLTDANYNVSMIVTDAGYGVERVFYTAYAEPEVFPFGDADGDYDVDTDDQSLIEDIKDAQAPYNILADLNLDGAVTQADLNAFGAYSTALGGRNVLTASKGSATTGNDIGYAGYTWNDERAQWHVRHREYDPKLGRWLQRDSEEYIDGTNMYEYSASDPLANLDAYGLASGRSNCGADTQPQPTNPVQPANPNPYRVPMPRSRDEIYCKIWAQRMCDGRGKIHPRCRQQCIDDLTAACMKGSQKLVREALIKTTTCNGNEYFRDTNPNKWTPRMWVFANCFQGVTGPGGVCWAPCALCSSLVNWTTVVGCLGTCAMLRLPGVPPALQPQFKACVHGCFLGALLLADASCSMCAGCVISHAWICIP